MSSTHKLTILLAFILSVACNQQGGGGKPNKSVSKKAAQTAFSMGNKTHPLVSGNLDKLPAENKSPFSEKKVGGASTETAKEGATESDSSDLSGAAKINPNSAVGDLFKFGRSYLEYEDTKNVDAEGKTIFKVIVPKTTKIVVVVNDKCRKDGIAINARQDMWIEKDGYLPAPPTTLGTFPSSVVQFYLKEKMELVTLNGKVESDTCIEGMNLEAGSRLSTSTDAPVITNDRSAEYAQQIGLIDGQDILAPHLNTINKTTGATTPIKVPVAVIDSGLDATNTYLNSWHDILDGSDLINGDDMPEDTLGHGTMVASVLGASMNASSKVLGVAAGHVKFLPLKAINEDSPITNINTSPINTMTSEFAGTTLGSVYIFRGIQQAVNAGAKVINVSLANFEENSICNPIIGQAVFLAIKAGAFVVMTAGNYLEYKKQDDAGHVWWLPGEIPAVDGKIPEIVGNKISPSCWGQTFKGAITVGGLVTGSNLMAGRSNFGSGVEIVAPSLGIPVYTIEKSAGSPIVKYGSGTSLATAQISGAIALMIAFHESKNWYYSPWILEDILLNASPKDENLDKKKFVTRGTMFNLKSLAEYLVKLADPNLSAADREKMRDLQGSYDYFEDKNNSGEDGDEDDGSESGSNSAVLEKLAITADSKDIYRGERAKFRAMAFYNDGSFKMVTNEVSWEIKKSSETTPTTGLVLKQEGILTVSDDDSLILAGDYQVKASYQGKENSIQIFISDINLQDAGEQRITELRIQSDLRTNIDGGTKYWCSDSGFLFDFKILAIYTNDNVMELSPTSVSWSVSPSIGVSFTHPSYMPAEKFKAGIP